MTHTIFGIAYDPSEVEELYMKEYGENISTMKRLLTDNKIPFIDIGIIRYYDLNINAGNYRAERLVNFSFEHKRWSARNISSWAISKRFTKYALYLPTQKVTLWIGWNVCVKYPRCCCDAETSFDKLIPNISQPFSHIDNDPQLALNLLLEAIDRHRPSAKFFDITPHHPKIVKEVPT